MYVRRSRMQPKRNNNRILITGATGYVGKQLIKALEKTSYPLRCLVRQPENLRPVVSETTEIVQGDLLDRQSLTKIFTGVHTAFYLVHSMAGSGDFVECDRIAARNFSDAAKEAGIKRIVYLGGLGRSGNLSPHLASRQEVGRILRDSEITTIEFRASVIIGIGSLSFEMVRTLVEKLPIMITPRWVRSMAQPIAIEDVIAYLVKAIDIPIEENSIFEIGGPEIISYEGLMKAYARQRRLHRLMIPVPVLTPYLSSLWLGLVTPLYARIGKTLVESIKNSTVVEDHSASKVFLIHPRKINDAIQQALMTEDRKNIRFRVAKQFANADFPGRHYAFWKGRHVFDVYSIHLSCPAECAFTPIRRIGGKAGWYYANWLWRLRGTIDKLIGGVGLRKYRPDPEYLEVDDVVDFWRVEAYKKNRLLRFRAEMKLPGRAWLQFEVSPDDKGSTIYQTAIFDPLGLAGLLYWYCLYPLHRMIFTGMLKKLARTAEKQFVQKDLKD